VVLVGRFMDSFTRLHYLLVPSSASPARIGVVAGQGARKSFGCTDLRPVAWRHHPLLVSRELLRGGARPGDVSTPLCDALTRSFATGVSDPLTREWH
jgi:hypothetical protein